MIARPLGLSRERKTPLSPLSVPLSCSEPFSTSVTLGRSLWVSMAVKFDGVASSLRPVPDFCSLSAVSFPSSFGDENLGVVGMWSFRLKMSAKYFFIPFKRKRGSHL